MASSEITVKLPSIRSSKVTVKQADEDDKGQKVPDNRKLTRATTFISRLQLGSLQRQKRPGDTWGGGSSRQPRPLGLIPDHQSKFDILKELRRFLPPLTTYTAPPAPRPSHEGVKQHPSHEGVKQHQAPPQSRVELISTEGADYPQARHYEAPPTTGLLNPDPAVPYRYSQGVPRDDMDHDYIDALATYDLHNYYTASQPRPSGEMWSHPLHTSGETWSGPIKSKGSTKLGRVRSVSSGPQFLSFSEQSLLWNRSLSDDRRVPLPGEPCARCLERGGRCTRCKALRVGGGYLILDADDLPDDELRKRLGKRYSYGGGQRWSGDPKERGGARRGRKRGDDSGSGSRLSGRGDDGDGSVMSGSGVGGDTDGRYSGLGSGGGSHGDGRLASRSGREHVQSGGDRVASDNRHGTSRSHGDHSGDGRGGGGGGVSSDGGGGGTEANGTGDGDEGEGSGRTSSRGIMGSVASRPSSTPRPASSLRRGGGLDRKTRDKRSTDIQGGHGRGRGKRVGDNSDSEGGSDNEGRGRRRRKKVKADGESGDESGDDVERTKIKFKSTRDGELDERPPSGYRGNLKRFKRKKDDVKAIHATLQELQGIDPLDYLAKYCIIDQTKLPYYQRCYDNVDRDEDDEIDLGELDFALKAVNYDLISDTEMSYVHSVLELAGRHKLNFRFFSLIAALSEKVVALEDMVKKLINKMDFDALEVKIKKCKELFYLLADADAQEHEGGVVTTGSLSVELQAGGLTGEHVDFVVDRLNHDNRGLVEFLDYLTYVPLFVEIHDSISGNPLDFSRTK